MSLFAALRSGLRAALRSGLSPTDGPGTPTLWAIVGDSNGVGIGIGDSADTGFRVGTPNTGIPFNAHYAVGTGPPPTFVDFPSAGSFGSLGLYAASSSQSMGIEMSMGPELLAAGATPAIFKMAVSGSTLATEWLPTSTYPAAGAGNLFNLWVARVQAAQSATGRTLGGVVVSLGTNDALSSGQAAAFQANMAAFVAAVRLAFGSSTAVVWIKTNVNTGNVNTPAVRSGQDAAVAADSTIKLVDNDDLTLLGDNLHYLTNGYLTLGQRCALALLDARGYARRTVTTTPAVIGYGPVASGAGNLTVVSYGGEQDGDLQVLDVGIGIVAGTITTPSGWTQAVASGDSTSTGVTVSSTVYVRKVTSALLAANGGRMPATTVTIGTSTRNAAKPYTVRGPAALDVTNVDATQAFAANVFNTGPVSITGVTTTQANELVLCLTAAYCGSSGTVAVTNGGLAGVTEVQDSASVIVTDRILLAATVGSKAAAGATGAWSYTSSANTVLSANTISIKP